MADNIMSFEDYLELIKRLRLDGLDKSKVDQATDKVLKVLDEFAKKVNTTKDGKVEADAGYDLLDAVADMQDPETYSKIMDLLNEKLAKDGDIYNISTPEDKMLGLANRYVTRAQEARYNRNWKLFGFYLRSLAYFVPLLIEKARMREEIVMQKIESGFAALQAAPQETIIPEDIKDRAKFLIKKNSLPLKYYPVLYMANPNRKLEYFAFMKPGYKNIDFYTFVKNKQQSVETSENLMEFRKQFKYYYRPEVLNKLKNKYKDFYKPEVLELMGPSIKVIWQDPALEIYTGKAIEEPEVEAATFPNNIKKLMEECNCEDDIPMAYLKTRGGKSEKLILKGKNSSDYYIIDFENGRSRAFDQADNLKELQERYKKYHSNEVMRQYRQPTYDIAWKDSNFKLEAVTKGYVETRDGEKKNQTSIKSGEWCWYYSKNGTKYAIHNVHGRIRAFKQPSNQEVSISPDMKRAVQLAAIETAAHINRDKLKQDLKVKFKLAADNAEQIDRKVKNGLYIKAEDFHKASRPYIIENYIESKGWYLSPYDKDYMLILED